MLQRLTATREPWDVVVIGGGATGLGCAVDAAARGYRTALIEQHDFAKATSSRSTKLIHGGVRYLQQGNVGLVIEALRERGLLTQNAPHLVHHLAFIVPNYTWWEAPFYGIGLKIYDILAGKLGLGPSRHLSREETLERLPTLEPDGLRGGVVYYDGQFDDARLAISLAQTAADLGAVVLNYMQATAFTRANGLLKSVLVRDTESGAEHELNARAIINATGVFTDKIRRLDEPDTKAIISASQGVHIVLDKSFMPGDTAIMVPRTEDGRVLFAIPWHDRVLVGTTDTPVEAEDLEPKPLDEELEFLLAHASRYLTRDPKHADVLSTFAGLRPLRKSGDHKDTASVPRDHSVIVSKSGLVTITGGKWTTYRKMAEDTVNQAAAVGGLDERPPATAELKLHGWTRTPDAQSHFAVYGDRISELRKLADDNPPWGERLHPALPYVASEVIWAVRHEMARTLEDVLSRRLRALLLDARAAIAAAPTVAELMAQEMGRDVTWQQSQVADFNRLAAGYVPVAL